LYDLLWFLFLIPWPPFMLWQFVLGFAILSGSNTGVMFPRWIGYFSLWAGALELFSMLSVFWYSGPFSYNGLVTFWVPGLSFFIWVFVFAVVQIKGWARVKDRADHSAAAHRDWEPAHSGSPEMPEAAQV
jgi:hypothetical protein